VSEEVKVYSYRWAVLLVFGLIFMIGQMMWLAFSLIRNEVTPVLGLPPGDPSVVLLTASQPLAFIILSIPVGMLADRKGLVIVAGLGAILEVEGLASAAVEEDPRHLGGVPLDRGQEDRLPPALREKVA